MAKRITPEFEPNRIVQPVASPVETYVQPVLVQPAAPTGGMQVAQALSSLSSSLSGLGEELLLERKQEDLAAGAMEDLSNFTPQQLRDYEEKAGGILPWRYQAALQAYGMNTARANYETKAFESLNFQAEPYNADGTPRTYEQVQQDLNKMWDESTKGLTGHYAKMGAMQVRAQVDNEFQNMWSQKRRSLIIQDNERQLEDRVVLAMQNGMNPFESLSKIAGAQENIYALGWGSAREVIMRGITRYINSTLQTADSGTNFEELRAVIQSVIDDGFGGPVPETFKLGLEHSLKQIEEVERNVMLRDMERDNVELTRFKTIVSDEAATIFANGAAENGGVVQNYSQAELNILATTLLAKAGMSPDHPLFSRALGTTANLLRAQVNALRTPIQSDPESLKRATAMVESGDPNSNAILQQMLQDGVLDPSDYKRLNDTANETVSFTRDLGSGWSSNLMAGALLPEAMYPDEVYQEFTEEILPGYEALILNEVIPKLTELRKTNPQDFAVRARAILSETKKKYVDKFQADYKERLERENLINGFEKFVADNKEPINTIVNGLYPKTEGLDRDFEGVLEMEAGRAFIMNALEAAYNDPELASLSVTERGRAIKNRLPIILRAAAVDLQAAREAAEAETQPAEPTTIKPEDNPMIGGENQVYHGPGWRQASAALGGSPTSATTTPEATRRRAAYIDMRNEAKARVEELTAPKGLYGKVDYRVTILGVQDTGAAERELRSLLPYNFEDTQFDELWRSLNRGLRLGSAATPEAMNVARLRETLGDRLGLSREITRQYLSDSVLAGRIGYAEIEKGQTQEGMSLMHAISTGDLDPMAHPLFKNAFEYERAVEEARQQKGPLFAIHVWLSNRATPEAPAPSLGQLSVRQRRLLELHDRLSTGPTNASE